MGVKRILYVRKDDFSNSKYEKVSIKKIYKYRFVLFEFEEGATKEWMGCKKRGFQDLFLLSIPAIGGWGGTFDKIQGIV